MDYISQLLTEFGFLLAEAVEYYLLGETRRSRNEVTRRGAQGH
jgi:hypothetical protein